MKRIKTSPRNNWQSAVEKLGFGFHTTDIPYWDESAYYELSYAQIEKIETATSELWERCIEAVQHVIDKKLYARFHIPDYMIPYIEEGWNNDVPAIYGRFDFGFNGYDEPKLLEFNADTPTSLFESAIVQWFWLQDFDKTQDQFNSVHEKLIEYWKYLKPYMHKGTLYFSCLKDTLEDLTTTEYLRDCAIQAGFETQLIYIDDIGWDSGKQMFVDLANAPMANIFKLYPWEWMAHEEFGVNILDDKNFTFWIEPAWKMLMSNKAILPVLWELFPNHKNLLPAYFEQKHLMRYVRKPLLSREGANVQIISNGNVLEESGGEYGEEGFVYQELYTLPDLDGNHPVLGSWIIGQEPAGMGIRESTTLITNNTSRFVPHLIRK